MLSADIAGLNYGLEFKYEETHNCFCIFDCGVCILFYRDGYLALPVLFQPTRKQKKQGSSQHIKPGAGEN